MVVGDFVTAVCLCDGGCLVVGYGGEHVVVGLCVGGGQCLAVGSGGGGTCG